LRKSYLLEFRPSLLEVDVYAAYLRLLNFAVSYIGFSMFVTSTAYL